MDKPIRIFGIPGLDALSRQSSCVKFLGFKEVQRIVGGVVAAPLLDPCRFEEVRCQLSSYSGVVRDLQSRMLIASFSALKYSQYCLMVKKPEPVRYTIDHIPTTAGHNRRPGTAMKAKYLTIHSTGNPQSTARNERGWLTNGTNTRTASFHIVVDETEAIECIPLGEVAWHAGDGKGSGNMESISIEICESGNRAATLDKAITVAANTLRQLGLSTLSLRRHYDWSKKNCPRILIDEKLRSSYGQTWEWFKSEVELKI